MIDIYFTIEKTLEVKDRLQVLMSTITQQNFKNEVRDYINASNEQVDRNEEVKSIIKSILDNEKIIVDEFTFKSKITQIPNEWYADSPKHSYKVSIFAASIDYFCVKVFDENNYLCYHTNDKQLRRVILSNNMKAMVK